MHEPPRNQDSSTGAMPFADAARFADKVSVAVPMNYMLKAKEMRCILESCGAEILIVNREGFIPLDDAMHAAADGAPPVELDPDQPVAVFRASGTTGFPGGATMSSRNLLAAQKTAAAIMPVGSGEYGAYRLPAVLEAMRKEKASLFVGVPAMCAMMLARGP